MRTFKERTVQEIAHRWPEFLATSSCWEYVRELIVKFRKSSDWMVENSSTGTCSFLSASSLLSTLIISRVQARTSWYTKRRG